MVTRPLHISGRRTRTAALLVLAPVVVLAACGTEEPDAAAESRPLTLMLNWTPNAHHVGIYAARQQGWYEQAGIDLEIVEPADAGVEQAVAAGAAQIGLAQAESLLPARAADVPVVSVATVLPVNDSALYGLAEDAITRPADLEGARYGGFGGALETEIISALVECDDADPSQVEFVTIGNVDYLAGMRADQFDVAWVFSGWDVLRAEQVAEVEVSQIRFADWLDCIPNWYTPLVLTSQDLIASDPDLVADFLEVTARGYQRAVDEPEQAAAALIDQVPELDPELVRAAVDYYAPRFLTDGRWGVQDEQTWVEFATFLTDSGVVDQPVDGAAAFTNEFLPRG